jgi:tetratricopeptide (TPR) repeat protein
VCSPPILSEEFLYLIPQPSIDDGFVFPWVDRSLVLDFTDVEMVFQELIYGLTPIPARSAGSPIPLIPIFVRKPTAFPATRCPRPIPEERSAALGAVQKSKILLRKNRPAEALVAAKKAVALQPENLLAQMALGDAQTALGDKNSARAAYELALAAAHRLEAYAQPLFVPDLEQKLHP